MVYPRGGGFASMKLWRAAQIAFLVSIGAAAVIGMMVYKEFSDLRPMEDNAGWPVSEFAYEFQRLLLAAEKGESLEEIRLRGDIYLSRVLLLRDAPALADLRAKMRDQNLARLFQSAQETERLTTGLHRLEERDALLGHLRADAALIRELKLDMLKLDRLIDQEQRKKQNLYMLIYLAALEALMVGLFALGFLVFRTTRKLRDTGRELARQLATQDSILKSVDTAIIGIGAQGDVLYSNPNAVALLGPGAQGSSMTAQSRAGSPLISRHCSATCHWQRQRTGPARSASTPQRVRATI